MNPLLEIRDLSVQIDTPARSVAALSGVSLQIERGDIVGLVGESGAGKTMLARAITALLPARARTEGEVLFDGQDVLQAQGEELRQHRGSGAALCFQNPRRALAPLRRVGHQIDDRLDAHHQDVGKRPSAVELLEQVGIRAAPKRVKSYPHELSGGMAQRVMFSLALACFPALIVADEPTTGLDVTLTRGILELLRRAAREENRAVLVISHDIAAIAQICDQIVVMYGGIVVEQGPAQSVLHSPAHPYTAALLDSVPDVTGGPATHPPRRDAAVPVAPPGLPVRGAMPACRDGLPRRGPCYSEGRSRVECGVHSCRRAWSVRGAHRGEGGDRRDRPEAWDDCRRGAGPRGRPRRAVRSRRPPRLARGERLGCRGRDVGRRRRVRLR